MPSKYKTTKGGFVHRVVWEAQHGPIPPGFHVHHKNGDKHDNRIENLTLVQHGAHISIHQDRRRPANWRCECGATLHAAFGLCKRCYDVRYNALNRKRISDREKASYLKAWKRKRAASSAYYYANREKILAYTRERHRRLRAAAVEAGLTKRERKPKA